MNQLNMPVIAISLYTIGSTYLVFGDLAAGCVGMTWSALFIVEFIFGSGKR